MNARQEIALVVIKAAMRTARAILKPDERPAVERRLVTSKGYFDSIRESFVRLKAENREKTFKLRGRRQGDPTTRARDIALAHEKASGKSWQQLARLHPEIGDEALRKAVDRGKKASRQAW